MGKHTSSEVEEDCYVPSEEALKFIAFLRATGNEENTSPEAHYKMADVLFSNKKKDWKVIIECLRGMGKSTIVEYVVIYVAALGYWPNFGTVPFIVFLGASQEGNVKAFFKNVAGKITNSVFLSQLVDVKRQTDNEIELVNTEGIETIAAGRGMATNWRGIRSRTGKRPTVLIADDVLPNDVMTSEVIRKTIETNWFNSALPALDPMKHKIIYIGTPLSEADLLHQLKNSKAYTIIRFPLCPKFPVEEKEFKSIWPDRFTYEYTKELYDQYEAAGTTRSFYTEYMLEITDLSTLLVEEEDIQWFDPGVVLENKQNYNFYIATDFATSTKKSADYSTIGVIAVSSNSDWLLVDGQCIRQTMQDNIDDLFRYVKKWNPLSVGIESSGQQGGFISIMQEMMLKRNIWFSFARKQGSKDLGIRPIKDKMHRFITGVQPKFKQGKVWLPKPELAARVSPRLKVLVDELAHELGRLTLAGGVKALAHDDACFLGNTPVLMADGTKKEIKDIKAGDVVRNISDSLTSLTESAIITGQKEVSEYRFSDGTILTMTANHPVLTSEGWVLAGDLTPNHEVKKLCEKSMKQGQSSMEDISGHAINMGTTNAQSKRLMRGIYTGLRGIVRKGKSLKDVIYTTKMRIRTTTKLTIYNAYQQANMLSFTDFKETWKYRRSTLTILEGLLTTVFIGAKKVKSSIGNILKTIEIKCCKNTTKNVGGAVSLLQQDSKEDKAIVIEAASFKQSKQEETKSSSVKNVDKALSGTGRKRHVPTSVDESTIESNDLDTSTSACIVGETLRQIELKASSAQIGVGKLIAPLSLSQEDVKNVEKSINLRHLDQSSAQVSVENVTLESVKPVGVRTVYNLFVGDGHNYVVGNGIVVHNCDLLNQFSEMDTYVPTSEDTLRTTSITKDGLMWNSVWDDEDDDGEKNSLIF